jgi:hypothetical protein
VQEFIDRIGKAAQQSASEAKLRLAVRTIGGKLDEKAQALGHLLFRRHQGEAVSEEEMLKLLVEMTQLKADRIAREAELEALHRPPAAQPAPAAEPAPAEEPAGQEAPDRGSQAV